MKKKKYTVVIVASIFLLCVVVLGFIKIRDDNRNKGEELGYSTGYSIGYTDARLGIEQNAQILAGEIAPYETGSVKWSGYMKGFPKGYSDAYNSAGNDK